MAKIYRRKVGAWKDHGGNNAVNLALSGPVGTVTSRWIGAPTANSITMKVKTATSTQTRLKASTAADLSVSPIYSAVVTPDVDGVSELTVTGLNPWTNYYVGVEAGPVTPSIKAKTFRTLPAVGTAQSFTFAAVSCQNGVDSPCWPKIKARDPLFIAHLGDLWYDDAASPSLAGYKSKYDLVLGMTNNGDVLGSIPTAYTWSDHDFAFENNGYGTSAEMSGANAAAAKTTYEQRTPRFPLITSANTDIGQTWVVGRVRFIMTDNRTFKSAQSATDNSSKTVLGTAQKAAFKSLITNCNETVIIWFNEQPWTGPEVGVTAGATDDEWHNYTTERNELGDYIAASGKKVYIVAGDQHAVAFDYGSSYSRGGIPVAHVAPLSNSASAKGTFRAAATDPAPTAANNNVYPPQGTTGTFQLYGFFTVTDTGSQITIDFKAYDSADVQRMTGVTTFAAAR